MQNKTKFIIFIISVIIIVVGIGLFTGSKVGAPSKFDDFAKALKSEGSVFYGAFWCTHCQDQKAEFGSAKQYLPYVECANPDSTQKQICKDNQIEGYPTWTFKDGIKLSSNSIPTICPINIEGIKQEGLCVNISSKFYRVWTFPEYNFSIKSPIDPIKEGNVWQFTANAQAVGAIPQSFLAEQINFVLP